jgi:hypothetical protein
MPLFTPKQVSTGGVVLQNSQKKKKKKMLAVAHSSVNPLEYTIMKPKCVHIMGLQAFQ